MKKIGMTVGKNLNTKEDIWYKWFPYNFKNMQTETQFQLGCKYTSLYLQYQLNKQHLSVEAIAKLDEVFDKLFSFIK